MKIKFYPEVCCEICEEIIHNHMDCPACGGRYVGTNVYSDMAWLKSGDVIKCEACGAKFQLMKNDEWEQI